MKGSFLIKASDLLTKNSIFQGAVVLKIDDKEYLEKGVLFLTPKGFNIRFLLKTSNMQEAEVFTVFLGTSFNSNSLKYYKDESLKLDLDGIFCFNFDLGKNEFDGTDNYFFTKNSYPANKFSFYYESSLRKNSFKCIADYCYGEINDNYKYGSKYFIFDKDVIACFVDINSGWTTTKISKTQKEKGFAKINQSLQVNVTKQINTEKIGR